MLPHKPLVRPQPPNTSLKFIYYTSSGCVRGDLLWELRDRVLLGPSPCETEPKAWREDLESRGSQGHESPGFSDTRGRACLTSLSLSLFSILLTTKYRHTSEISRGQFQTIAIKQVLWIFWFPSAYKSYDGNSLMV